MKCLLIINVVRKIFWNDGTLSDFSALAYEQISRKYAITFEFFWLERHLLQVIEIDVSPLNVRISQIAFRILGINSFFVKHFSKQ